MLCNVHNKSQLYSSSLCFAQSKRPGVFSGHPMIFWPDRNHWNLSSVPWRVSFFSTSQPHLFISEIVLIIPITRSCENLVRSCMWKGFESCGFEGRIYKAAVRTLAYLGRLEKGIFLLVDPNLCQGRWHGEWAWLDFYPICPPGQASKDTVYTMVVAALWIKSKFM